MKQKTVSVNTDFEFILISSLRYVIGRKTYACSLVAEYIKKIWNKLSDNCKSCLQKDLQCEIDLADKGLKSKIYKEDPLGHECDRKTWENLNDWMMDKLV